MRRVEALNGFTLSGLSMLIDSFSLGPHPINKVGNSERNKNRVLLERFMVGLVVILKPNRIKDASTTG